MSPVAPRIVLDVSFEMINHQSHFLWPQYLVKLEDASCPPLTVLDVSYVTVIFGEVGVSFFVAGAALRKILGDSRRAKCCIFPLALCSTEGCRVVLCSTL